MGVRSESSFSGPPIGRRVGIGSEVVPVTLEIPSYLPRPPVADEPPEPAGPMTAPVSGQKHSQRWIKPQDYISSGEYWVSPSEMSALDNPRRLLPYPFNHGEALLHGPWGPPLVDKRNRIEVVVGTSKLLRQLAGKGRLARTWRAHYVDPAPPSRQSGSTSLPECRARGPRPT